MRMGAAYIRVSTDDQLEYSPDSQLKEIHKYAKANNITITDKYIFVEDEGRSGRNVKNRPAFQEMISTSKEKPKPFDVILVWKFSRFARNQEESIVYKSLLRNQCEIDVVSVSEPAIEGPFGSLIERIIEWMDEFYSTRLSGEVKRGMIERISRGGVVSYPPFGYVMGEKDFAIEPKKAEIIRYIFDAYANGATLKGIAVMLNERGIRTTRGNNFENRTVKYILQNQTYIGKLRWSSDGKIDRRFNQEENPNVITVDGNHEHIISQELFDKVQARLSKNKTPQKYMRESATYLLQGLLRCSNCGSTLVSYSHGYQCHSYAKGACNKSHYINIPTIESMVLNEICGMSDDSVFTITQKVVKLPNDTASSITREQQKLKRIEEAYIDGIDTLDEYRVKKDSILKKIAKLQESNIETKTMSVREILNKNIENIKKLQKADVSPIEKNAILKAFVEKVVFNRTNSTIQIFLYI